MDTMDNTKDTNDRKEATRTYPNALEAGIRQEMNAQPDDNGMDIQRRIQYYISSSMLTRASKGDVKPEELTDRVQVDAQELQALTEAEKEQLRQAKQAELVDLEKGKFQQVLENCKTKMELQEAEETYLDTIVSAYQLIDNNVGLLPEQRKGYTLLKDEKLSAIKDMAQKFRESDAYKALPAGERSAGAEDAAVAEEETQAPEEMESRRRKAQSGYESARQSIHELEALESGQKVPFDAKG